MKNILIIILLFSFSFLGFSQVPLDPEFDKLKVERVRGNSPRTPFALKNLESFTIKELFDSAIDTVRARKIITMGVDNLDLLTPISTDDTGTKLTGTPGKLSGLSGNSYINYTNYYKNWDAMLYYTYLPTFGYSHNYLSADNIELNTIYTTFYTNSGIQNYYENKVNGGYIWYIRNRDGSPYHDYTIRLYNTDGFRYFDKYASINNTDSISFLVGSNIGFKRSTFTSGTVAFRKNIGHYYLNALGGSSITATLPALNKCDGCEYTITFQASVGNTVTFDPNGSEQIYYNGSSATTKTLTAARGICKLVANGSFWAMICQ